MLSVLEACMTISTNSGSAGNGILSLVHAIDMGMRHITAKCNLCHLVLHVQTITNAAFLGHEAGGTYWEQL